MVASMFTSAHKELVTAVRDMRTQAGLTQRALADAVGREQNYIARIETGQRRVDLIELVQICRACKVEPQEQVLALVRKIQLALPQGRKRTR